MATEVADPSMRRPAVARAYPGSIVEAATLQDASPASDSVVLYTHMMCPYAQRAWLVLVEKNAPHTLVHVDLSSKPEWFLRMNPRGQVPFAALQGDAQGESLDICRRAPCGQPAVRQSEHGHACHTAAMTARRPDRAAHGSRRVKCRSSVAARCRPLRCMQVAERTGAGACADARRQSDTRCR